MPQTGRCGWRSRGLRQEIAISLTSHGVVLGLDKFTACNSLSNLEVLAQIGKFFHLKQL
jgi:hypothetical protein